MTKRIVKEKKLSIRMPPTLHKRIKIAAAMQEKSINSFVVDLLDERLPDE